jgi:hypothetical protein
MRSRRQSRRSGFLRPSERVRRDWSAAIAVIAVVRTAAVLLGTWSVPVRPARSHVDAGERVSRVGCAPLTYFALKK